MKKTLVLFLALLVVLVLFGGCTTKTKPTPTIAPTATPVVTVSPNVSENPNAKHTNIITETEEKVKEGVDKMESAVPKMAERDTTTENRKTSGKTY